MSLPPEKIAELKQIIHTHLNQVRLLFLSKMYKMDHDLTCLDQDFLFVDLFYQICFRKLQFCIGIIDLGYF